MKILIHTGQGAMMLSICNIVYCEADGKYTNIFYENKRTTKVEKLFSNMLLSEIEKELSTETFYRCHKSLLINFNYFFEHNTVKCEITLTTGEKIDISRRKKPSFKENLLKFISKYRSL